MTFFDSQKDSAYFYFNRALTTSYYGPYVATAQNRIAVLQFEAGDYYGSEETAVESLKLLDKQDSTLYNWISSNYTVIGNDKLNQKLYDDAIVYFDSALKLDKSPSSISINQNNRALAFQKEGKLDTAIAIYTAILPNAESDPKEYARIISNLALTKWQKDSTFNPLPDFFKALKIQTELDYRFGQNASFAHLSTFYAKTNTDSSSFYARKMYQVATELQSVDDQLEALQRLINSTRSTSLNTYFHRYQVLADSIATTRGQAQNKYALLRYNSEIVNRQNLLLQKDNERNQTKIRYQRGILLTAILAFMSLILYGTTLYKKRKRKIETDSQNTIREHQLKTSQKLHDVVANGLYRIMNEIEHHGIMEKDVLLNRIESLYEQSRDLSHDHPLDHTGANANSINQLLLSFSTKTVNISTIGNSEELWKNVPAETQNELHEILQELFVNMQKHSHADKVLVKFEIVADNLEIQYKDNGVGFNTGQQKGKGLLNTENRIRNMKGKINFDGTNGLQINLTIPISPNDQ